MLGPGRHSFCPGERRVEYGVDGPERLDVGTSVRLARNGSARRRPAGGKRVGVLDRLEGGLQGIAVGLDLAGRSVGDGDLHLDVGQSGREHPEAVEPRPAGVEHLQHDLDVGGIEEREVAGVGRELHRLTEAGLALGGTESHVHAEAPVLRHSVFASGPGPAPGRPAPVPTRPRSPPPTGTAAADRRRTVRSFSHLRPDPGADRRGRVRPR